MINQGGVEIGGIAIIEDDENHSLELSKLLNTQGYETVLLTDFGNPQPDELKQYSIETGSAFDINLPYENGYEYAGENKTSHASTDYLCNKQRYKC